MKGGDADVVLDHEVGQTITVNQYHFLMHVFPRFCVAYHLQRIAGLAL
jgi:hypothetical protein